MFDSLGSERDGQGDEAENAAGEAVAIRSRTGTLPVDYAGLPVAVDEYVRRNLPTPRRFGDEQRQSVAAFIGDNPEFAGQPDELIAQYADTYRSEREQSEQDVLHAEGVPQDWADSDIYTDDVLTSDDL